MKFALTILLILGFVGIAVFGVFAMDHGASHEGCLAATARGVDCPKAEDVNSFLAFHLDTFKSFSTAVFGDNLANALLFLVVGFLFALGFAVSQKVRFEIPLNLGTCFRHSKPPPLISQKEFIRWLSLHENSPSFA